MGAVLVTVEKTWGGETWANTHCLTLGGTFTPVTDADMTALGVGTPVTDANTSSSIAADPMHRLIAFERLMHDPEIQITRLYVTDGLRNAIASPDYFFSVSMALPGKGRATTIGNLLAPGNIAWVINRIPLGFNSRPGRAYYRGLIQGSDAQFNGRGGVSWLNSTQATTYAGVLATALSSSSFNVYLANGTGAGVALYSIPHYQSKRTATLASPYGQLVGATPITSLVSGVLRSRQMLRGKKRKTV